MNIAKLTGPTLAKLELDVELATKDLLRLTDKEADLKADLGYYEKKVEQTKKDLSTIAVNIKKANEKHLRLTRLLSSAVK